MVTCETGIASVQQAIKDIAEGKFVIVIDEVSRENEGDLILAGEKVSAEKMAFLLSHTTGIVCASVTHERAKRLDLPAMVQENQGAFKTAFTVSVDAGFGITTGVSAADRAKTVQLLSDPASTPASFVRPGHVFPLVSQPGGVVQRPGHTEASMDLMQLAGMQPCGIFAELVNADHSMMRQQQIWAFAEQRGLTVITVDDLITYRLTFDSLVSHISSARLPTKYGEFSIHVYESVIDGTQHFALVKGNIHAQEAVPVRVHSECLTGDILGSCRCDCGAQLDMAIRYIAEQGLGVIVYLRGQEGRGIGFGHKIRAYALQDLGYDTVDANLQLGFPIDAREYGMAAQILKDLQLTSVRLITHNPKKFFELQRLGIQILDRIILPVSISAENEGYLRTKKERMGHWLDLPIFDESEEEYASIERLSYR
ncbi:MULTISPECIES: bifunctional 3,4-dihydroxy-2-butanone-4-phosphate synthase/GTP cyclohydrolase II [Chlamydia]|uniref:Riboflavin biosynthesis protein RibBA n=5 Tax=Chlamydia suis TaxID=83559 RepID=A0AAQ0EMF2_9CHLA|nr:MULTISPECIES: bifunctional 3,4-dihydroxy-2-butanone-4-phosphate synthase/GTP cyclohydrolase II [Chlamydia]MEB2681549.1 bifunctional 3,4-dihydroxy-2-butanone-4-phosphate synthase/GTP cyclohydrolase II [Chlamydia suis]MEB2681579.1 bifunctional 3,4-dihydroxy-2-butanone-4-phosphate synthase/GTP cyclohydrolase II [Chlamydia suis]MEB2682500.1 bifunctional 3,4-dihydroxy-2-butanone-4-phosphate synthase/GTP cyclohydrolase II [Chlamydia suis]MEB2684258.1 bifunctional 3,4-dihydroxy-2-butanone-4-phospha